MPYYLNMIKQMLKGNSGKYSLMRFISFMGTIYSGTLVVVSVVGFFFQVDGWEYFLWASIGIMGGSLGAKAAQKPFEGKPPWPQREVERVAKAFFDTPIEGEPVVDPDGSIRSKLPLHGGQGK